MKALPLLATMIDFDLTSNSYQPSYANRLAYILALPVLFYKHFYFFKCITTRCLECFCRFSVSPDVMQKVSLIVYLITVDFNFRLTDNGGNSVLVFTKIYLPVVDIELNMYLR